MPGTNGRRRRRNLEDVGAFEVGGVVISTRVDVTIAAKLAAAASHARVPLATLLRTVLADYVQPSRMAKTPMQWIDSRLASSIATETATVPAGGVAPQISIGTQDVNRRWPSEPPMVMVLGGQPPQ